MPGNREQDEDDVSNDDSPAVPKVKNNKKKQSKAKKSKVTTVSADDNSDNDSDAPPPKKQTNKKKHKSNQEDEAEEATVSTNSGRKKSAGKKKKSSKTVDSDDDETARSPVRKKSSTKKKANEEELSPEDKAIEHEYQKLSTREKIFLRPSRFIGSIELVTDERWVVDPSTKRLHLRSITYIPALLKLFDEILVNAADNKQRDPENMTMLKVTIDMKSGRITVWNNGRTIPVRIHPKHQVYIAEMVFSQMNTSSNYDDSKKKTTGGTFGEGSKLVNMFSSEFVVETCDSAQGLRYTQVFRNNNRKADKEEPLIKKVKTKSDYTQVSYVADWKKFDGMTGITQDLFDLFAARVYEIAGTSKLFGGDRALKVYLNDELIPITSFEQFAHLHFPLQSSVDGGDQEEAVEDVSDVEMEEKYDSDGEERKSHTETAAEPKVKKAKQRKQTLAQQTGVTSVYQKLNDRWEVVICANNNKVFQQRSFVNAVCTVEGGTHVRALLDKILPSMREKLKKMSAIQPQDIKAHMWIFLNCLIENASYNSQTKETLVTDKKKFGGEPLEIPATFLKRIMDRTDIVSHLQNVSDNREQRQLKATDGKRTTGRLTNIPKLDDANFAGGKRAEECVLLLTEGDSAKATAISGLSVIGRDRFGVFALRGKLLNVREASTKQILKNTEVTALKQILGLQTGKKYTSTKGLRYGSVMTMTDSDVDGSHIRGLIINMFATFWPELLQIEGFMQEFITPIIKVKKQGQQPICFYSIPEFDEWKEATDGWRSWSIKYYKGLGTSTAAEAKEYFSDLGRHQLTFVHTGKQCTKAIEKAFAREHVDLRKQWLADFVPGTFLDQSQGSLTIKDFVNKELILFSNASNERAIASVVDGLKPGMRKIMFVCFMRKLFNEIKVAQLAGSVAEKSAYHHGEVSLTDTIVGLAQNFVGATNINLLVPVGMFGTRASGGGDAASARYIFTHLSTIARALFPEQDDPLLKYLEDDGESVEPQYYAPVVPTVLLFGVKGIGTGHSTDIPCFDPRELVLNMKRKLNQEAMRPMHPAYKNFKGTILPSGMHRYKVFGIIEKFDDTTLIISELPIRVWTDTYKEKLIEWEAAGVIESYLEYHGTSDVKFVVYVTAENMLKYEAEGLYKRFKLIGSIATSNMVAFDPKGQLKRYEDALEIIEEFYPVRLMFYQKRKAHMLAVLQAELKQISNRVRFILACNAKPIEFDVHNRKDPELLEQLLHDKYDPIPLKFKKGASIDDIGNGADPIPEEEEPVDDEDVEQQEEVSAKKKRKSTASSASSSTKKTAVRVTSKGPKITDFDYLLLMSIKSLTYEKVRKLRLEEDQKKQELSRLTATSIEQMWIDDLDHFVATLDAWEQKERDIEAATPLITAARGSSSKKGGDAGKKKRKSNVSVSTKAPAWINEGVRVPIPDMSADLDVPDSPKKKKSKKPVVVDDDAEIPSVKKKKKSKKPTAAVVEDDDVIEVSTPAVQASKHKKKKKSKKIVVEESSEESNNDDSDAED